MPRIPLLIIATFFLVGGIAHFVFIDLFIMAMPDFLGYHKEIVIISGVFELLGSIGILLPKTRLLAAYALILLIIVVYPANINMALHPEKFEMVAEILLYIRLPLQFIFVWFVWWAIAPERECLKTNKTITDKSVK